MKWRNWSGEKKEQIFILLLIGVLLLVIALPTKETPKEQDPALLSSGSSDGWSDDPAKDWTEYLEQKFQAALSQVDGVGRAEVILTVHSGGRALVEKDEQQQEDHTGEKADSTTDGSSSIQYSENTVYEKDSSGKELPFVSETILPEITGVLVLAQGAADGEIRTEITEAAMALFGLEAHKIKVMKLE